MTSKPLTNEPKLIDVLNLFREEIFTNLNCHGIGTIQSFNVTTQRAEISIAYSRQVDNQTATKGRAPYPLLLEVPVMILGGGKGSIRFPIQSGDSCLLFFNDRDIDNWIEGGDGNLLNSDRKHSFGDAFALIGPRNSANALTDYNSERTELAHDKTFVSLKDKVRIKNSVTDLYTVINGLFTELAALVPTTGIPAANKANIAALQIQFQQLMEP